MRNVNLAYGSLYLLGVMNAFSEMKMASSRLGQTAKNSRATKAAARVQTRTQASRPAPARRKCSCRHSHALLIRLRRSVKFAVFHNGQNAGLILQDAHVGDRITVD